jgi:preprotein translocase subunit SecD
VAVKDRFGTTYFMSPEVELTEADIRSAEFLPTADGRPRIKLLFTGQGATKFRELTRSHLKRPLVFLINGKVALAPLVNEVASGDFTWVEGLITEADAKAWTMAINSRKATLP